MDNVDLTSIAKEVFGDRFKTVKIRFSPETDLKVRWARDAGNFIDMRVTDYLKDISDDMMKGLLSVMKGKMFGEEVDYTEDFTDFVRSKDFRKDHVKTYLERSRIQPSDIVEQVAMDLMNRDYVDSIEGLSFGSIDGCAQPVKASVIFKSVAVDSSVLGNMDKLEELVFIGIRYAQTQYPDKPRPMCEYEAEYLEKQKQELEALEVD